LNRSSEIFWQKNAKNLKKPYRYRRGPLRALGKNPILRYVWAPVIIFWLMKKEKYVFSKESIFLKIFLRLISLRFLNNFLTSVFFEEKKTRFLVRLVNLDFLFFFRPLVELSSIYHGFEGQNQFLYIFFLKKYGLIVRALIFYFAFFGEGNGPRNADLMYGKVHETNNPTSIFGQNVFANFASFTPNLDILENF